MSSISFIFPIKPYSINSMYYRDRSIITKDAREWQLKVLDYLSDPKIQTQIKQFKEHFDIEKHLLQVEIQHYYPESFFITKKGSVSSKTFDLSNIEKPLIDLVLCHRYSGEKYKNLEIDDKNIIYLKSSKGICEELTIIIKVDIIDYNQIPRLRLTD